MLHVSRFKFVCNLKFNLYIFKMFQPSIYSNIIQFSCKKCDDFQHFFNVFHTRAMFFEFCVILNKVTVRFRMIILRILSLFLKYLNPSFILIYLNCHVRICCIIKKFWLQRIFFFFFLVRRKNGKIFYRRCTGLS